MANRYWVGGTATWNATAGTKWALTSGGAGGQAVPTSSDDVFFDAASGAVTVTVGATSNCANIDFTGFTGTFAGSSALNIYSSMTLATGMTRTFTGAITFAATATGKTITLNGKTTASAITFDGVGGGWTVQDNWDNGSSNITLTNGALDTNGKTITLGAFSSSNSNTRTLTLGASTINCSSWTTSTITNLTFNANTSTIINSGTTASMGALTYYNLSFTSSSGTAITGALTCNNFTTTIIGTATIASSITINGTLTATGANNSSNRTRIFSSTYKTARAITAATCSLTNVDFRDITAAGAGIWSGTSIGDCGGNTGITTTTPKTAYWVNDGTTAHNLTDALWFTTSGGAVVSSYPLPQDTGIFDANSFGIGSCVVTANSVTTGNQLANLNWTGVTNSPTFTIGSINLYGDLILSSGMSLGGTGTILFLGVSGSYTFNTANLSFTNYNVNINARTGVTTNLLGDLSVNPGSGSSAFTLAGGIFRTISSNITAPSLIIPTISSMFMGSGVWEFTDTGIIWNVGLSGANLNTETSTIKFTNNSASSKTFSGSAGQTYYNFWNATGGAGVVIQDTVGSIAFNDFKINAGRTQQFRAGSITNFNTLTASGTLGNVVTITSSSAATHTLSKRIGGNISLDYMNISYSIASQTNTFYAGANSTNSGNNTNWIFSAIVPSLDSDADITCGYNLLY